MLFKAKGSFEVH